MIDDIIAPLFSTEWGRRAGWTVMICLSLLIAITLYFTLTAWYGDILLVRGQHRAASLELGTEESAKLIAQLPERHLFGQSGALGTLPITSLQLRLVGIVKADPEQFSRVIISEGGKPGKVYQLGDTLPSGVKVNSITNDGVVLENGGRLEKLPLQRSPLLFQGMPKPLLNNVNTQEE